MSGAGEMAERGAHLMPDIRVPALWTFGGLVAGLALGMLLPAGALKQGLLGVLDPMGTLWLHALQMTIVPLVAALLVSGIVRTIAAAEAGPMARRTLLTFFAFLAGGRRWRRWSCPRSSRPFRYRRRRSRRCVAGWPAPTRRKCPGSASS